MSSIPNPLCCSFCGADQSIAKTLIAGPRGIFICSECVQLCCDILVEQKESGQLTVIGEHAPVLAELQKRVSDLDFENRRLLRQIARIADSVAEVIPRVIHCMWCDTRLESEQLAKEHVGSCESHPAVVALKSVKPTRRKQRKAGEP